MKYILTLSIIFLAGCNLEKDVSQTEVDLPQMKTISITSTTQITPQEEEVNSITETGTSGEDSAY